MALLRPLELHRLDGPPAPAPAVSALQESGATPGRGLDGVFIQRHIADVKAHALHFVLAWQPFWNPATRVSLISLRYCTVLVMSLKMLGGCQQALSTRLRVWANLGQVPLILLGQTVACCFNYWWAHTSPWLLSSARWSRKGRTFMYSGLC